MKLRDAIGIALVSFVIGAVLVNRLYGDHVSTAELSALLAEKDSSVAVVTRERDLARELGSDLRRQMDSLEASPEVVTRIVVERDTVQLTDTVEVSSLVPPDAQPTDTVTLTLEPFAEAGVTVEETVSLSPPPSHFVRSLTVRTNPDTLTLALVRDPNGIARIIAAAETEGVDVRSIFAGEVSREPSFFSKVWDYTKPLACLATGYAAAEEKLEVAGAAGVICLAGFVIKR